jgi:YHS domain-containing protein
MNMKARDPVCGGTVETTPNTRRHILGTYAYYFCSDGCMSRFMENPSLYAGRPWGS